MYPTDRHYLFNIAEEMQFLAARCAQGNSICMYGKSVPSGVEAMNRANEDIHQKIAVDILNATLILLKKESTWYNKQQDLAWNHAHVLTPKGMELMEEAFNNVKVQDFNVHLTEHENEHTAIVSKKSTSHREYSVNLPMSATLGSRFGNCTCGFPKKEGTSCQHMVAVSKLGRIDGLTRTDIMPHWYTTAQWRNQFPRILILTSTRHSNQLKQTQLHMMNCITAPTGWGPRRKVVQRRISARRVLLTMSSNQQRRSAGQLKSPKLQRRREWIWKVMM
jgi:hypothetical protein